MIAGGTARFCLAGLKSRWQSFQSISVFASNEANLNLRFLHSEILIYFMLLMLVVGSSVQSASIINGKSRRPGP